MRGILICLAVLVIFKSGAEADRKGFRKGNHKAQKQMQKQMLQVTTVLSDPYVMKSVKYKTAMGNERFEGFCVDLMEEISRDLRLNYSINVAPDAKYGHFDKRENKWSGMIGELVDRKADLAVADLTITTIRSDVVDFSKPWMTFGIGVLYKKMTASPFSLFSFLSPFTCSVWILVAASYFGTAVVMYFLSRAGGEQTEDGQAVSLCHCLWFGISYVFARNRDVPLKSTSVKVVAACWHLFNLLVLCAYVASLTSYMSTIGSARTPLNAALDLAGQTSIKYGCVHGGSTCAFFKNSLIPTYTKMHNAMEAEIPSSYTKTTAEGVARVQSSDGAYAFLMESSSIQYITARQCDLTQVGGLMNSVSFGVAFPKGSQNIDAVNEAILNMREDGRMDKLHSRWWLQKRGGTSCKPHTSSSGGTIVLDFSYMGGIFFLLVAGIGIAGTVAVIEFVYKKKRSSRRQEYASNVKS